MTWMMLGLAGAAMASAAAVPERFTPAAFETQRIEGMLGERLRVNLEGRLLHVDEPRLLRGFEQRPGEQAWIGEHVGKYLDAACNTWRYTHDARLKTQMDRIALALMRTQRPDGYLGTYTDDQRWTQWDVWVHKYDLIGLLNYHETTGNAEALAVAKKVGDLLARTFGAGPGQRDLMAASTHVGMAASSVLEPMVTLYRLTGEKRYLDFCWYIVHAWDQPDGPKILASLRTTGSVFKTANAKAYEMMSDLVGVVELYKVTGDASLLAPVETAWHDIRDRRLYITGTTSSKEHFQDDDVLPGEDKDSVGEGCATVTWLQLTWRLFRLTGEPEYAEEMERTVYNQLLGAQDPHNGNICYFTPLDGTKKPTPGINCCVSSEPRGISLIPEIAWGATEQGSGHRAVHAGFLRNAVREDRRGDYVPEGRHCEVDGAGGEAPAFRAPTARAGVDAELHRHRWPAQVQGQAGDLDGDRARLEGGRYGGDRHGADGAPAAGWKELSGFGRSGARTAGAGGGREPQSGRTGIAWEREGRPENDSAARGLERHPGVHGGRGDAGSLLGRHSDEGVATGSLRKRKRGRPGETCPTDCRIRRRV